MSLPVVYEGQFVHLHVFGWGESRKVTAEVESFDDDHIYVRVVVSDPAPPSDRPVITYSSQNMSCVMCWGVRGVMNQLCEFE